MTKTVLLLIAFKGYQPVEYGHTRDALEKAGIQVVVGSTQAGMAQAAPGAQRVKVDVTVDAIKPENYDGIFLIGGSGALEHLDNAAVYGVMQQAAHHGKAVGAICISPRILAKAGLLKNKKATGWDDDGELGGVFKIHAVTRVHKPVVVDGTIITADGPRAAAEFGKAIVDVLK